MASEPNIRTVIVDDEAHARGRIRQLLQQETDFELVGEYASGRQAIAGIQRDKPDLAFLDVQMPQLSGFDVCQGVASSGGVLPLVVFVTAYDQYALQAFEVHAIDYLLKPFDRARFQKSLDHAREQLCRSKNSRVNQRLAELLEDLKPGYKKPGRLVFKEDGRIVFVCVETIDWLEADGNYIRLHAGDETHYFRETMSGLESQLPADTFARINRSTMVNLDRVKELQPKFCGDQVVLLQSGVRLTLTRKYRGSLNRLVKR